MNKKNNFKTLKKKTTLRFFTATKTYSGILNIWSAPRNSRRLKKLSCFDASILIIKLFCCNLLSHARNPAVGKEPSLSAPRSTRYNLCSRQKVPQQAHDYPFSSISTKQSSVVSLLNYNVGYSRLIVFLQTDAGFSNC